MIPRRVLFAILIAFISHGFFILAARYRLSYDAYTHMLFADHYAKDWFSLWEPRWYTGFEVVSYPPLTHQLIALLVPIFGFDKAYALILWLITTLYPLGIYAFSRIFAGKTASSYAALASATLLPIYVTAHIFGQLPFLTATLFALFGAATLAKYLREGGVHNLLLAISLTATTMAAHHATLLVQPFFILALVIKQLNANNLKNIFSRLFIFLIFAIPAGFVVIWPFWQWGLTQQLQTSIDHPSRHNLITDAFAQAIFFWPFYLPLGAIIPFIFYKWDRNFLGLQFTFIMLFILGLGGTTKLPSLLFGKSWEWLTYDRFAFWAGLTLTPFFGILFIRFRKWVKNRVMLNPRPAPFRATFISASIFSIFACASLGAWFTPMLFPIQPAPIDMQPIVDFLEAEDHYYWRYLTFGFGDQFAHLSLLTDKATTLDGSYHTARTIPELRESGIGQIDTAYWALKGIPAIGPILNVSGEYGVRWGFVNRREFISELKKNGWVFVKFLKNGIQVWENPNFTFQPSKTPTTNPFESFSWGIFPMFSLITTFAFGTVNILQKRGEQIIRKAHGFIVGLIPLSLGFWYYKTVFEFPHKQVYFTYDHAFFFLSDGLAIIALLLWLAVRASIGAQTLVRNKSRLKSALPQLDVVLFALCCWVTLSTFWSTDWRTSIYIAIHFWLIFLLILSLQEWRESWNIIMLGLCALLSIEIFAGTVGFIAQSTEFLNPLKLPWPGSIDLLTRGASILKLTNGQVFLRAYGTLPHPNIAGGFILVCLAGPIALFLRKEKSNWLALILLALGCSTLALTFSRSAWLGVGVFFCIMLLKSKILNLKKVLITVFIAAFAFGLTLYPLRELFMSRAIVSNSTTEEFSIVGRAWLMEQALVFTKEHPLRGIGIGSFVIQIAEREGERNFVEPVHNIPLLILSELGVFGFILLLAIVLIVGRKLLQTDSPKTIIIGAIVAGLGTIAFFDHYLWTLAPGRILLGLVIGLWQSTQHE